MLWGPLDFTQQFPRVYLHVIKWFASSLNYSYFSLRFPSYIVSCSSVFLCWSLMKRLYPQPAATRYLFVLILLAHQVFMDYFVQIKHYEMEIFLSLVAIWQLTELLSISEDGVKNKGTYLLLCISFLLAPFFSYTYPIGVMPLYIMAFMRLLAIFSGKRDKKNFIAAAVPLFICFCGIAACYFIDISQVIADQNMHQYWSIRMSKGNALLTALVNTWRFFANVGAGFLFEIVFAILGIASILYAITNNLNANAKNNYNRAQAVRIYCIILVLGSLLLCFAGHLPLGEPKFGAYTVPAISILIISFLDYLLSNLRLKKVAGGFLVVLMVALIGNIVCGVINMTSDVYTKRISIHLATEKAIKLAHDKKIPIFITPAIGFPDDIVVKIPFISMPTPAGVLKAFPAYQVSDTIAIYDINDYAQVQDYKKKLSPTITTVLVGDGLSYKLVNW